MDYFDVSKRVLKFLDRRQIFLRNDEPDFAYDQSLLEVDENGNEIMIEQDHLCRLLKEGSAETELRIVCRHLLGMYHATVPPIASVHSNRRVYIPSEVVGENLENDNGEDLFEDADWLPKAKKRFQFGSIALELLIADFKHPSQISAILWLLFGPTSGVAGGV